MARQARVRPTPVPLAPADQSARAPHVGALGPLPVAVARLVAELAAVHAEREALAAREAALLWALAQRAVTLAEAAGAGEYLTVEQTARALQVDPESVRRWAKAGRLRTLRLGGVVRVPVAELGRLTQD